MKNCKKCNNELPDDAKFCSVCGSQIEDSKKWYENFFNVYVRFLFFRFSIGSFFCFLGVFVIGFAIFLGLSELLYFSEDAFTWAVFIILITATVVTTVVTKRVRNKQ